MSAPSRYVVGLDLGTTNCAVSFVEATSLQEGAATDIRAFPVAQLVRAGEVGEEDLLPSFLYMPAEGEFDAAQLALPWAKKRTFAVGRFARDHGAAIPTRLVASSKSWLCHPTVDRQGAVLPLGAEPSFPKISPVEATRRLLEHVRDAWNHSHRGASDRFEEQEIVLTVPASFDAVARELTMQAARDAGLERVTLFEEPQAAFYAWLYAAGDAWRNLVRPGDVVLVVDVGGGTSDFTVIGARDDAGDLALERLAVGDHLLVGGDNMDLALAHMAAAQVAASGGKLDSVQMLALWHAARTAKEKLFSNPKLDRVPLAVLGRGRKVIGGALKTELRREQVEAALVDGFFPRTSLDERPATDVGVGLKELGLPYVADPAVTRHLAAFLRRCADMGDGAPFNAARPTAVLFNGGVFQAEMLRRRVADVLSSWTGAPIRSLETAGLDRAVATGAAYYGLVRRGRGVRIRGGVGRSYYIGVASSMPAVPGVPPPVRAVCLVPKGTEEGSELELPSHELGLVVGEEVEFRFLGSTSRVQDAIGDVVDDWEGSIEELAPVRTTIEPKEGRSPGQTIPVRLHGKVTEVGTLELWFQARDSQDRWKLEFNVRQPEA